MASNEHVTQMYGLQVTEELLQRLWSIGNYAKKVGITTKSVYARIHRGTYKHVLISGVMFVVDGSQEIQ